MKDYYVNFLIWAAAKLNVWSYRLFHYVLDQCPPPTPPQAKAEEPEKQENKLPTLPTATTILPLFLGEDNQPIPVAFDELPTPEIFTAMFERKYGKGGLCPMAIGGQTQLVSVEILYALLKQIRHKEDASPTQLAMYGTIMSVIMHAHGEIPDSVKSLN